MHVQFIRVDNECALTLCEFDMIPTVGEEERRKLFRYRWQDSRKPATHPEGYLGYQ